MLFPKRKPRVKLFLFSNGPKMYLLLVRWFLNGTQINFKLHNLLFLSKWIKFKCYIWLFLCIIIVDSWFLKCHYEKDTVCAIISQKMNINSKISIYDFLSNLKVMLWILKLLIQQILHFFNTKFKKRMDFSRFQLI